MCASSLQRFLNAGRNSVGGYYKYDIFYKILNASKGFWLESDLNARLRFKYSGDVVLTGLMKLVNRILTMKVEVGTLLF